MTYLMTLTLIFGSLFFYAPNHAAGAAQPENFIYKNFALLPHQEIYDRLHYKLEVVLLYTELGGLLREELTLGIPKADFARGENLTSRNFFNKYVFFLLPQNSIVTFRRAESVRDDNPHEVNIFNAQNLAAFSQPPFKLYFLYNIQKKRPRAWPIRARDD